MITFSKLGTFGRLGNEMFQYAATKAAAQNCAAVFAMPTENQTLSKYFDLSCKFYSLNQNSNILNKLKVFQEACFEYNSTFKNIIDNTDIVGYFQTEKYFKNIEDEIRKDFSFKYSIKKAQSEKIKSIKDKYNKNIVSLHVRRTDYVNLQQFHPLCTVEYYVEAMSRFERSIFLVFSDDIEWCKANFVGDNFIYSENNSPGDDLCLMSLCDNNIIANSSFSWWAAWLNNNKNKQVICPKVWFGQNYSGHNTNDLYCDEWNKI